MQMTVYPVLAERTLAPEGAESLAAAEAEIDRLLTELS